MLNFLEINFKRMLTINSKSTVKNPSTFLAIMIQLKFKWKTGGISIAFLDIPLGTHISTATY